jgi:hypothetical protein
LAIVRSDQLLDGSVGRRSTAEQIAGLDERLAVFSSG